MPGEDYVPQVMFGDPEEDARHGWHRIEGTKLGYGALYLVICDEGCLHLASVSDEYGMAGVDWLDIRAQAANLSPGVDIP